MVGGGADTVVNMAHHRLVITNIASYNCCSPGLAVKSRNRGVNFNSGFPGGQFSKGKC